MTATTAALDPKPRKPRRKTANADATPPPYEAWASKEPTQTFMDYVAWLQEAVGRTFTDDMIRAAYLAQSPLRQRWQAERRENGSAR